MYLQNSTVYNFEILFPDVNLTSYFYLSFLAGERILGHGSDVFSMCRDIEEALESE
jgi:hypothetical protein